MHVIDDSGRNVQTRPAGKPPAKSNIGIVAIGEEMLVKEADDIEHFAAIQRGGGVEKQDVFAPLELAPIRLAGSTAVIQPIGINQVAGFVDAVPVVTEQDLAGAHADARSGFDSFDEFLEPSRLRLRVIV